MSAKPINSLKIMDTLRVYQPHFKTAVLEFINAFKNVWKFKYPFNVLATGMFDLFLNTLRAGLQIYIYIYIYIYQ